MRCLWAKAKGTPGVRVFTNCFSLDLITGPGGGGQSAEGAPVLGAITHHPKYGLQMIWAKATILASGGAGMVYRETTNPKSASGDGLAMAFRAGATVADMAFVQFHPTTLYLAGASRALITEAIRGEGAYLVDAHGERFMVGQHPMAELAPRDVVSRAIVRQIALRAGTNVFLDVRHLKGFAGKFPGIAQLLAKFDLDPMADLIPIHPAAHYMVGGVLTDLCGRTDLPNLYAAGEVACVGLHGANRLASNSLLEGLVMGEVAGRTAKEATTGGRAARVPVPINSDIRPSELGELDLSDVASSLRSAMWRHSGIERSGPRLADVLDMLDFWARYTLDKIFDTPEGWQTQNMLLVASLIARSAAWRTESRGCHWRSDHPRAAEGLRVHDCWRRGRAEPLLRPVAGGAGAAGAEGLGAAGGAAVAEAARA
jgi:L-aspartate oxidase